MRPKPRTRSFTAWLPLEIYKPGTSSSHLRLFYDSDRVVLGKTQVGADLGLHHLENPSASKTSGQLQTLSEHHHPTPSQPILHRGWWVMVSGHSKSLKLIGLGKSLPLICQQQPRLNYKRSVYSAHMEGAPQIPSLSDRGGYAPGPYMTPTTLGHTTKTRNQSSST